MRPRPAIAALAAVVGLLAAGPALASPHAPSQAQIRTAVRRAVASRGLWATINVCNTKAHPHAVGIRGQIPALGFRAQLTMAIEIDYWKDSAHAFVPDPTVTPKVISLGRHARGLHQGGYTLTFMPPALLRGRVTFRWLLGRRVIGHAQRLTAPRIKHVDGGDPPGYSAATCKIS